ncbi:MAG: STAS domain-containing protein, partial [Firmicutes bacterium]|nr:STAS domain-containing protein [Bacillota bacterium]
MKIEMKGRIDSNNAPQIESEIMGKLADHKGEPVEIDAEGLEYISSAGLRVLLRIRK